MKAAILDDGVYDGFGKLPGITEHLAVNEKGGVTRDESEPHLSHGTRCAQIIAQNAPHSEFISIKVLDEDGKGYAKKLIAALDYCLHNKIKLIHMSIGTSNFHDFEAVAKAIENLTDAGVIIVAAYDNYGTKSLPAWLPKVFGVRASDDKSSKPNSFYTDKISGIEPSNFLVASNNEAGLNNMNSFAAPVITGKIYEYLRENEQATFGDVMSYLSTQAEESKKSQPFFDYNKFDERETPIPVISVDREASKMLYNALNDDGYHAECFTESDNSGWAVPLSYYTNGGISNGAIYVLWKIYQPDIMLFELEARLSNIKNFDLSICKPNEEIKVIAEEKESYFGDFNKAYDFIKQYFS